MIFEQHYLDCLSQASYFIGDESSGRAVVVDPRRDVSPYIESAKEHDMTIELVLETHFHADFLSGHLELAEATGAAICYGAVAQTEFDSRLLAHGERLSLGEVELEVRHTPGHTPESISIVVYERAGAEPHAVLTGDTLFIGDVGRPDLLSSKGVTADELAGSLYDSLHGQLMTLPDETRVYPAHGAGSACGKNLSTDTWSTIGEQRLTNYAVADMTKTEFIDVVTTGQTAPPNYFSYDAGQNRVERPLLDEFSNPTPLALETVLEAQRNGAVVLDARSPDAFGAAHIAGSINVGIGGRFAEYAGGVLSPETPIVLVTEAGQEREAKNRLGRIGFDHVIGAIDDVDATLANGDHIDSGRRVDVAEMQAELAARNDVQLLDVRQPGETAGGTLDGAILIPLTRLTQEIDAIDRDRPVMIYCAGGYRSSIAASVLRAHGCGDVADLLGGYGALSAAS